MIILIDAYNLLKQIYDTDFIGEREQARFVAQLGNYARKSHNTIELVFDGGPFVFPSEEKLKKIRILYAGQEKTADDIIKQTILNYKGKEVLLVTRDHELISFAEHSQVPSIDPALFYECLLARLGKAGGSIAEQRDHGAVKSSSEENSRLDQLMLEASRNLLIKDDQGLKKTGIANRKKFSKKERKLLALFEKL